MTRYSDLVFVGAEKEVIDERTIYTTLVFEDRSDPEDPYEIIIKACYGEEDWVTSEFTGSEKLEPGTTYTLDCDKYDDDDARDGHESYGMNIKCTPETGDGSEGEAFTIVWSTFFESGDGPNLYYSIDIDGDKLC